jgi:hypothetical protein
MTARPPIAQFGDAIPTNGVRLPWLPDDVLIRWIDIDGVESEGTYPADTITAWRFISAVKLPVPRYDFVYLALERGMEPWFGQTKEAPKDFDGGSYLCRDGNMYFLNGWDWGHGTHCDNSTACWDRIGYTRKATSTTLPLAHPAAPRGEEGEVERLRAENERLRNDIRHIQRNTATYRQEARAEADRANARAAEANTRADNIAAANRTLLAAFESAPAAIASGRGEGE